jgi:PiT family inorganic phosphate transporter
LATRVGLPISTTHALVGGLVGAGVALAPGEIFWAALGGSYFLPLLVSPVLALAMASVAYPLANRARRAMGVEADTCLCIGEGRDRIRAGANGAWVVERTGLALSVDEMENCRDFYTGKAFGVSIQAIVDRLHELSAFALGFARGLNDTPKVLALLVTVGWAGLDPKVSLAVVATSMAVGGYFRAHRVADTLAHGITTLTHGQGLLANSIASGLVITASLLGSPVSTTHVSTGALFGIGLWNDETNWTMISGIVGAWVGTLPVAAALAALMAHALG